MKKYKVEWVEIAPSYTGLSFYYDEYESLNMAKARIVYLLKEKRKGRYLIHIRLNENGFKNKYSFILKTKYYE